MDNEKDRKPDAGEAEGGVPPAYEASQLNLWTIILAGVALVVVVALVHALATLLFGVFALQEAPLEPARPPAAENGELPPIQDEADAPGGLVALRATQTARLQEYAWINPETGVVAIPIERAMQVIAEEGLPDFAGRAGAPPEAVETPGPTDQADLAQAGAQVFQDFGCNGCHQETDTATAPGLQGIYGTERVMESGETAIADEEYLREAILVPHARVVQGYQNIMPSFEGRLSEDQLEALLAYIASLGEQ